MGLDLVKILAPALALCAGCTLHVQTTASARVKCEQTKCEAAADSALKRDAAPAEVTP
jgi:hypothetical protein